MLCEILSNELMVDNVIYDYIYITINGLRLSIECCPQRSGFAIGHIMCFFLMVGISTANNLLLAENK